MPHSVILPRQRLTTLLTLLQLVFLVRRLDMGHQVALAWVGALATRIRALVHAGFAVYVQDMGVQGLVRVDEAPAFWAWAVEPKLDVSRSSWGFTGGGGRGGRTTTAAATTTSRRTGRRRTGAATGTGTGAGTEAACQLVGADATWRPAGIGAAWRPAGAGTTAAAV